MVTDVVSVEGSETREHEQTKGAYEPHQRTSHTLPRNISLHTLQGVVRGHGQKLTIRDLD